MYQLSCSEEKPTWLAIKKVKRIMNFDLFVIMVFLEKRVRRLE
jgi:hypothetical protein